MRYVSPINVICAMVAIFGLIALICLKIDEHAKELVAKEHFMDQCLEDRKQYECDVMWNSLRRNPMFHPVYVPI